MWYGIALLLALLGMLILALSLDVHWRQVWARPLPGNNGLKAMRVAGFASQLLCLLVCLQADRASMAVLVWCLLMTVAALLVAALFTYVPATLGRVLSIWGKHAARA